MILLLLLILLPTIAMAGPQSVPPVEITLQKIEVRPAEPYNPQDFLDPQPFPSKEAALDYIKSHGGVYVYNVVLKRDEVLWEKRK
jgi:hypothetical protein